MENSARNRLIGGILIGAIILILLLVLFSCTVNSDLQSFGYAYHRDDSGYKVTVEVDRAEPVPADWDCRPKKGAFRTAICEVPIPGAEEPQAAALTEQEVRRLVQEEMDRIRSNYKVEPVSPDPPKDDTTTSWVDVAMVLIGGLGVLIAGVGLIWGIYTQRDHVVALTTWLRRRSDARVEVVRVGPGPLRHPPRVRGRRTDD